MSKKAIVFATITILMLGSISCSESGQTLSGAAIVAQETAVAQATRDSLSNVARATRDAAETAAQATRDANAARATTQALDAAATVQTQNARATAQAAASAQAAQATARSRDATATATAAAATATIQAAIENVQLTAQAGQAVAAQATAETVQQRQALDRVVRPAQAAGWVLFLLACAALLLWALYQLLPVIKARAGTIYRDERGDPPVMALATPGGLVMFDPTRSWGAATIFNHHVTQPQLAAPAAQDGTTKRAQFVDMVKGGRPRPAARRLMTSNSVNRDGTAEQWTVQPAAAPLPTHVPLLSLFQKRTPSLNSLVLGITANGHGPEMVSASLHELMHVLAVGASGWGKSTWLRSLLWQIAQSSEPCGIVAIDLFGSEFNLLQKWERLLYPVARSVPEAAAVLRAVSAEIAQRKALFEQYPLASKLTEYNRLANQALESWIIVFDEGTAALNRSSIGKPLRDAVQTARQYGIYIVLAGQSVKASVLDTETRDQFSTRIAFRVPPSSSRVVLETRDAGNLNVKGRAYIRLAGRELLQIQAPLVSRPDFLRALQPGGPRHPMPDDQVDQAQDAQIRALAAAGASKRQIQRTVFGYAGGAAFEAVTAALGGTTTQTAVQTASTA